MTGRMRPGWASIAQLHELLRGAHARDRRRRRSTQDVDVLMVVHPKELPPQTLYAIDQFVMRGGKLIAFVDPQSENDPAGQQGGPMAMVPRSSTLGPLLDAWGVAFDPGKVLGDRGLGLTVSLRQGEPPSQHIAIVGLNRDSMNAKDVVTVDARLDQRHDRRRAREEGRRDDRVRAAAAVEHGLRAAAGDAARVPAGQPVAARGLQADRRALRRRRARPRQAEVGVSERRPPRRRAQSGEHSRPSRPATRT